MAAKWEASATKTGDAKSLEVFVVWINFFSDVVFNQRKDCHLLLPGKGLSNRLLTGCPLEAMGKRNTGLLTN